MGRPAVVRTITVNLFGVAHHGTYFVQNSAVYVQSVLGNKATHLGASPPEITAKLLLSEIIRSRTEATH